MKQNKKDKFYEELVASVKEDFIKRREERRGLEQQWNLNINYLLGNQHAEIAPDGQVREEDSYYYWQNKNVYNQIAPIIETRLAKLSRVRPMMSVRAASGEDCDLKAAKIASDLLDATAGRVELDSVISKATLWSETLGTAFYKIMWNGDKGKQLGEINGASVKEGDVDVIALSPFEVFPDSLFREEISDLKSIIHARAVSVDDIYMIYGQRVDGEDIDVFSLSPTKSGAIGSLNKVSSGVVHDSALVIERYERPSKDYPNGRVVTIAGDKLLNVSELPYINGVDGARDLPFVKQTSINQAGMFYGSSIIERLTEEGLQPGKVIVYRQGSTPPQIMPSPSVPIDFTYEEERLANEFVTISGVSEISRHSAVPTSATSGIALQLLIEQDETRLSATAENIRKAVKSVAKHIIRLFRQFAKDTRVMKIAGKGRKAELFYYNASDLSSDDVVFDTDNELSSTPAQKKNAVLEILSTGILAGKDGMLTAHTKAKILDILGYGSLDNVNDLATLHTARAAEENLSFSSRDVTVEEYDDHELHLNEHTRYLISGEITGRDSQKIKERAIKHLREHKKFINQNQSAHINDLVI